MLSRTAENLFWTARYLERAEGAARLIEMGQRMAMLPRSFSREEWRSVAMAAGAAHLFEDEPVVDEAAIIRVLMLDKDNPSSIRACLERARANARAVRVALTRDVWETLNEGWRRLEGVDLPTAQRDLPALLDWVKQRAALFRGAATTSMLRSDRYDFLMLGAYIERADFSGAAFTAPIVDGVVVEAVVCDGTAGPDTDNGNSVRNFGLCTVGTDLVF